MSTVMDSVEFQLGQAKLVSYSPSPDLPWRVIFEDEGDAAYCYACDGRLEQPGEGFDSAVLDAMLVYNVKALRGLEEQQGQDTGRTRLATMEWSRDGRRAVLRLDGIPQALVDFQERISYCRSNFPNFLDSGADTWRRSTHAWSDDAMQRFESEQYD